MRQRMRHISSRRCRGATAGFTFLEVMLVVVILGLAMAITLPNMRPASGRATLEQATRRVIGMVRYARATAISTGETIEIFMDFEKNTIEVRDPLVAEVKERDRRGYRRRGEEEQGRQLMNFEDYVYALPETIKMHQIATYEELMLNGGKQAKILFYPDGRASRCTVTLRAERVRPGAEQEISYRYYSVEVYHATGAVHSYVGLPEELEDVAQTIEPLAGKRSDQKKFNRLGRGR